MRKAVALILIVILVIPLLIATLSVFSVSTWALKRQFYIDLFSDPDLYVLVLADQPPGGALITQFDILGLPAEALAAGLKEVLTPEQLSSQAKQLIHTMFDAVEEKVDLDLVLDLGPLKSELRGEGGRRFATAFAESLPLCTSDVDSKGGLPSCRPKQLTIVQTTELIQQALPSFLDTLPDLYPLQTEPMRIALIPVHPLWLRFVGSNRLIWTAFVLAGITLIFMLASAAIAAGDRKAFIYWLGSPLFFPALLMLAAGLGIWISGSTRWWPYLPERWISAGDYAWALQAILPEAIRRTLLTVARGFLTSGAAALALGVGLYLWSRSLPEEG